ncbi:RsfA family transcriptional regulator [Bacillus sp. FJAT-27251]|uniref:RsfA family transcriptional regulator n=1 Tax=Bacillus sp. FJAT-27251 TaxID=1684142 RepID=UPI0006A7A416|nr:RsfA family transcriptional regulator [Bacillus sp. FJAT-27251]
MKVRQDAWTEENDLLLAETVLRHVREGSTQLNAFEEVGDKLDRTSAACGFRWNAVVRHRYEKALQLAKKQRKQRQRVLGKDQGGKKKLLYSPPVPTLDEIGIQPDEISAVLTLPPAELNTLEMQDKYGLDGLQNLQESMLLQDSSSESEPASAAQSPEVSESEPEEQQPVPPQVSQPAPAMQQQSRMTLGHVIAFLQNMNSTTFHADIYKSENERLQREMAGIRKENEELKKQIQQLEDKAKTMQEDYETLIEIMNRARKLVLFEEEERSATKFKMDRNGNLEKVAE